MFYYYFREARWIIKVRTSPSYYSELCTFIKSRSVVPIQVPKLSLKGKVYVTLLCEGAFEAYGG